MAGTRKGTYKVTNWRKYNESLVQRGPITFWFCEETVEKWRHANSKSRSRASICLQRHRRRVPARSAGVVSTAVSSHLHFLNG